jgi:tryptophan synthase beta chain
MNAEGLASYVSVTDDEALAAFRTFSELEGIVPALEAAHAIAWLLREGEAGNLPGDVLLLLSGRGDKDVETVRSLQR